MLFFWSIDNALTAISCRGGSPFCPLSRSTSNSMCEYANRPIRHIQTRFLLFDFAQRFCIKDIILLYISTADILGSRPTEDRHETPVLPQFLFVFESFPKSSLPKVLMKKTRPPHSDSLVVLNFTWFVGTMQYVFLSKLPKCFLFQQHLQLRFQW